MVEVSTNELQSKIVGADMIFTSGFSDNMKRALAVLQHN